MKNFSTDCVIIKRCPFCGSPAEFTSESKEFVRCSKGLQCSTESAVFTPEDWNNRPLEQAAWNALWDIYELCNQSGFISTDAKFNKIKDIVEKTIIEISQTH